MSEGTGRVCVVTGGAGSIGGAIVRRLRADGWGVVSLDLGEAVEADASVRGDVADPAAHAEAADRAA